MEGVLHLENMPGDEPGLADTVETVVHLTRRLRVMMKIDGYTGSTAGLEVDPGGHDVDVGHEYLR